MNAVTRESPYVYSMPSRSDSTIRHIITHNYYDDTEDELGKTHYKLTCDCKGYEYKGICYHIRDVREFISINPVIETMIRETPKEPKYIRELKDKSDGEYRDPHDEPVLVETDPIDGKTKRLYSISLDPAVEGLWIPRIELSLQERKRIIKDVLGMEKQVWIMNQQKKAVDIEWLSDSDLFRYYKMMNELVGNDITA